MLEESYDIESDPFLDQNIFLSNLSISKSCIYFSMMNPANI